MLKLYRLLTMAICMLSFVANAALNKPTLNNPKDKSVNVESSPTLWLNGVFGALYYEFEYATNAGFTGAIRVKSVYASSSVSYAFTKPLPFNTTYYWRARSRSNTDSSAWTSAWSFTTDTNITVMYPPVLAGPLSPGLYFGWYRTAYFQKYAYEFDTVPTFNSSRLRRSYVDDTFPQYYLEIRDKRLSFGDTFYWRMRGINATDSMRWLPVRKFWTVDTIRIISPPTGILNARTSTLIEWGFDQFLNYQVETDTSVKFDSYKRRLYAVKGKDALSLLLRNLEFDQVYYWRLRGYTDVDTSRWTFSRKMTTVGMKDKQSVTTPASISPIATFSWLTVDSARAYQFQADTSSTFNSPWLRDSLRIPLFNPNQTSYDRSIKMELMPFGTTIYQRVRPMHDADTGGWSRIRTSSVPVAPSLSFPYNNLSNVPVRCKFYWQFLAGVNNCRVQRDVSPAFDSPGLTDTLLLNSEAVLPDMKYNTTYYWRVQWMNEVDTSAWSKVNKITTQSVPVLQSPVSFLTSGPGVAAKLDWDSMPGTKQFEVVYDTTPGFQSAALSSMLVPGDSSYADISQLYFGRLYHWKVRAINGTDTSGWSLVRYFYTFESPRLDWPYNKQTNISFSSLDWRSINGTTGYHYMLSKDSLFTDRWEGMALVKNPFFHYFNSNPTAFNTRYFWKIRVFHARDTSLWSETWSFTTRPRNGVKLIYPANHQVDIPLGVQLSWNTVQDATQYVVEYSEKPDMSPSLFSSVSINNKVLSLKPLTHYYWRVVAKNKDGIFLTDSSEIYHFVTAANFQKPVLSSPANMSVRLPTSITFTWLAVRGAEYDLQFAEDTGFSIHRLRLQPTIPYLSAILS